MLAPAADLWHALVFLNEAKAGSLSANNIFALHIYLIFWSIVFNVGLGLTNNVQFLIDWIVKCVFKISCAFFGIDNLVASVILIESKKISPVLFFEGLERHEELTIIEIDIASILVVFVLGF